jgi:uncharacterized protein
MQNITHLVIFAKEPRPGHVKTRLSPPLSPVAAAALAAAFVSDLARRLAPLGHVTVALPPGDAAGRLAECVGPGVAFADQGPGDLGEKLARVTGDALAGGATVAVAIGADHPHLPLHRLREAIDAARAGDAGWIPTDDGGFACIAVSRLVPGLFEGVPWSTPGVAAAVRNNARTHGVSLRDAGTWYDVDTAEDLRRLVADPDSRRRCPGTMRVLDEWRHAFDEGEGGGT